ncbi:hypothetical protein CF319_g7734 [Tilletia indica]|nr:hypothetical protein CF319_g7734 [Tilletia indica]KAE8227432.1 hypothetical protein CF326_g7565 [Tilletia indica]
MSRTNRFVLCLCARCGPSGQTVARVTRDQHELDDLDPFVDVSQSSHVLGDPSPSRADEENHPFLFDDSGVNFDWVDSQDGRLTGTLDQTAEQDLAAVLEVDEGLVPTLLQLRKGWVAIDESEPASRTEGLWLFELLLVWLNATFGLSEQVCALLLTFVEAIVAQTSSRGDWIPAFHPKPHMSVRLRRVRQSLWQGSVSVLYALCPDSSCWTPHLFDGETPAQCSRCQEPLLQGNDASDEDEDEDVQHIGNRHRTETSKKRPRLSLHYEPLSSWLTELARREQFFELCDQWRTRVRQEGVFEDIYDGAAWQNDALLQDRSVFHLSLTLMVDSVQPFSRNGTAPYSCCVISLRIDNLPRQHRNSADSTHVCCILPGPKKPKLEALQSVMQIIVAEVHRLSSQGLDVVDWSGRQRHVRARIRCLIADTEARTTVAGFPHHSSKDQFCPWCDADGNTWVHNQVQGRPFTPRTVGDHRRDCLAALRDTLHPPSAVDVLLLRRAAAAAPCALYKLDGWSSLTMAPVDVMHALDLGLCKHFWTETLTAGGLLKGPDLKQCQHLLTATTYPAGMTKISVTLGDTGGGSPTAHGWSILSRYLLPILLALSWSSLSETEKTFASSKRTLTSRDKSKAKKPVRRKSRRDVTSSDDGSSMTSGTTDGEKEEETGPSSRIGKRKRVTSKRKTAKTFSTPVSLTRLVEASLHLAHAARLAHAYILVEAQLIKLDAHLSDFVKILATDLHPKWLTYNFHVVLHITDQIRLHGTPRGYWAYPSERLYGLMKQVKTNRHRNGQIEFSLLSRTDDRHRVSTVVNSLPPIPLALTLKNIIDGHRQQGGKGMADEDFLSTDTRSSDKPFTLNSTQLEAVCDIANKRRPAGNDPLVPLTSSIPDARETIVSDAAVRRDRVTVKNSTLAPKSTSSSSTSDPSFCIVQVGPRRQAARFQYGFSHTFFEESAGRMITHHYAEVQALDSVSWPTHGLFLHSMWKDLGYLFATSLKYQTLVVSIEDIVCAALSIDTASIAWAEEGTLVAVPT